jgi:hypothetical protein
MFEKLGVRFFIDAERVEHISESTERTPLVPKKPQAEFKSLKELVTAKDLHRPLMVALGLQLAQQMSGINAAIYYSTSIFQTSYSSDTAIKLSLLIAGINLVMTIVSSALIERLGRRPLLLAAQFTMGVFAFTAAILPTFNVAPILIVICLNLFVAGFGLGLGSIPWLILPELVPSSAVGIASSICASVNWTANFIVAIVTPYLIQQCKISMELKSLLLKHGQLDTVSSIFLEQQLSRSHSSLTFSYPRQKERPPKKSISSQFEDKKEKVIFCMFQL